MKDEDAFSFYRQNGGNHAAHAVGTARQCGDLLILLQAWGPCGQCAEDLDELGDVGFGDLLALLASWS